MVLPKKTTSREVQLPADPGHGEVGSNFALALTLLRELAESATADHTALRHRAVELVKRLEARRRAARSSKGALRERQRAVDDWILDIFRATESAIPRETLLDEFASRWEAERRVVASAAHRGPWMFVFAEQPADGRRLKVEARRGSGVHPEAFDALCRQHLPNAQDDPYLAPVLAGADIDGWLASFFDPSPLFDALLNVRARFQGERNYWVSAIALPGDDRFANHGLFLLYPNQSDPLTPEPPSTLRQDQRLMSALRLAWDQLEHRVDRMARLSDRDRRDMLSAVAPGLMHHELGNYLRTLYGQTYEHFNLLRKAAQEEASPALVLGARYAHNIGELALRAHRVTHVFNSFDKRTEVEPTTLDAVVADVLTLLHHRLGEAGVQLLWDHAALAQLNLVTDVVLLSQAVMNIVANSANALQEGGTPPPRTVKIDATVAEGELVVLRIFNNGPPIPEALSEAIFRRGFTTRRMGHGQGLYLVRRIAFYLGGSASLLPAAALPQGHSVGFEFTFKRVLRAEEGLARAVKDPA